MSEARNSESGDQPLRVVLVDRPDAVQTVVRFVMPASSYADPAATLVRNDRPFSELGEELDAIAKVTDADLNALVRDVVALERGLLVLVGDKTSILAQLEGLDLPTPIELTVTADPVID